jgi:hypothetical protein
VGCWGDRYPISDLFPERSALSWLKAQEKSGNLRLKRFPFFGVSFVSLVAPEEEAVVTVESVRDEIALPAGSRMRWGGCGVVATATAVPVIPSGQNWPSPARGACTSATTPRRVGRAGMVLLAMILLCPPWL